MNTVELSYAIFVNYSTSLPLRLFLKHNTSVYMDRLLTNYMSRSCFLFSSQKQWKVSFLVPLLVIFDSWARSPESAPHCWLISLVARPRRTVYTRWQPPASTNDMLTVVPKSEVHPTPAHLHACAYVLKSPPTPFH